jgi:aminopeptidase-like protein
MNLFINKEKATQQIQDLLIRLFPIHRTLVNEGYKNSLEIIKEVLPLKTLEFASGKQVYDWVIPNSWNVQQAYIENKQGKKIVDFQNNNLHLSAYSQPFKGTITHDDLRQHLNFREDLPDAIPYNFHYYRKNWSFNISQTQFLTDFNEIEYKVCIEIDEYADFLRVGELFIKGETDEEIWITSYMCHPSMVNDNLSGVVTVVELFKNLVKEKSLKYSYRLLIVPETIGAVAYLAHHEHLFKKVKAGFTVYCCGDAGVISYKRSYSGASYIDKVFEYAFKYYNGHDAYKILNFWPGGSDERQFNGTGIRLPMGSVTRTPAAEFKEYHTSLDNLELIKASDIAETLMQLWRIIQVIEADGVYSANYKGEPCFSRHDIKYPDFKDALKKSSAYNVKILANETDGVNSLLDIATKWNLDILDIYELAGSFEKENLFTKIA